MALPFPNKTLFAHRGASADAPENTLPAMQVAKEKGAQWVEFDVTLSKDGMPFVFHDKTLKRTTNMHGYIAKTASNILQQADAGAWFSSAYTGTTIPTLAEMLSTLAQLDLSMNLEIKPHDKRIPELVDTILDTVQQHWPKHKTPPLFSSFSRVATIELRARSANAHLGLLMCKWHKNWEAEADQLSCETVHLSHTLVTPDRVSAIKKTHRKVFCYTVDTLELARNLFDIGVDGVFSDYANLLQGL